MTPAPRLVVFAGPPCSGKSTLAREAATHCGFVHLEMDRIRRRLIPGGRNRKRERVLAYRAMHLTAEALLQAGVDVALDATFGPLEHRRAVEDMAVRTSASLFLVQCIVAEEEVISRFRVRVDHPARDLTRERVATLSRSYPYFTGGLTLDTSSGLESCLGKLTDHLRSGQALSPEDRAWSETSRGRWNV